MCAAAYRGVESGSETGRSHETGNDGGRRKRIEGDGENETDGGTDGGGTTTAPGDALITGRGSERRLGLAFGQRERRRFRKCRPLTSRHLMYFQHCERCGAGERVVGPGHARHRALYRAARRVLNLMTDTAAFGARPGRWPHMVSPVMASLTAVMSLAIEGRRRSLQALGHLLLSSSSWATCGNFCLLYYSYSGSPSWLFTVATVDKSARPPGGLPCTGTAAARGPSICSAWPRHPAGSDEGPTDPRSPVHHLLVCLGRKSALVLTRQTSRNGLRRCLGPK